MNISFHFTGIDELMQKLFGVKSAISSKDTIEKAAAVVHEQMQKNVLGRPGPIFRTGQLFDSIQMFIESPTEAVVGPTAFYARYVEMGHRQHPGQYVPVLHKRLVKDFCPAYPFVAPVLNQVTLKGIEMSYYDSIIEAFAMSGAMRSEL